MLVPEKQKIVVIGNGMVGHHFIKQLTTLNKQLTASNKDKFKLITFSEEPRLAYNRVNLSTYFSGSTAEDLALTNSQTYLDSGVEFYLNQRVCSINRQLKSITTTQGTIINYDKLILATGSTPFVPSIKGGELSQPHLHVYRTLEDLDGIAQSAKSAKTGTVIGGGLLGLEAANSLNKLGLLVNLIEYSADLMTAQLDHDASDLLREKITALDINVHTEKKTTEIIAGESSRYRMIFSNGDFLETDLIIYSAGIRPRDQLAKQAGLTTAAQGGIIINDQCLTNDKDIYAIGECARWNNRIFGLVAPGYRMAEVAVSHLNNGNKTFSGSDMSTKLKLLDIEVASIGDVHARTAGAQNYAFTEQPVGIYKKIVVSKNGQRLLGAIMVGGSRDYDRLRLMVLNQSKLSQTPQNLLLGLISENNKHTESGVDILPVKTQICACYDVSKQTLCEAVANGAGNISSLTTFTGAGTGCGTCVSLVKQIMQHELNKQTIALFHNQEKQICVTPIPA